MFCAQCGQRLTGGTKFCSNCGAPAPSADAPSSSDSPPQPAVEPVRAAATAPVSALPPLDSAAAQGLLARIKGILLSPSTEWPRIAAEPATAGSIYMGYVAPLAAIGVIAGFIGHILIGVNVPFVGHMRTGVFAGLATAILGFLLSFLSVFLVAWLVDVLAPTFGGQRDSLRALKVTAYSYTPAWVAGILHIIPALGVLAALAGLYGLYLLYLGLPVLMQCPKDKSVGYTVVLVICAIVIWVVIGALSTCAIAGLGFIGLGAMSSVGGNNVASADAAGVLSNVFGGKTDADRARVGEALSQLQRMGEQAERADKSSRAAPAASSSGPNSAADMTTALNAVGQIMTGGKDVQPIDFRKLKEMLPETLQGMRRNEASGQSGEAMGIKGSSATARYSDGANASLHVEIADMGSLSGLAGLAAKFDPNMEKETDSGYERTTKVNGQLVHERYDRRAKSGEVSILIGDRISVVVDGSGVDAGALKSALKEIDLSKLAALTASAR